MGLSIPFRLFYINLIALPPVLIVVDWYSNNVAPSLLGFSVAFVSVLVGTVFSYLFCVVFANKLRERLWFVGFIVGVIMGAFATKVGLDDLALFNTMFFYSGFLLYTTNYNSEVLNKLENHS